MTANIFWCSTLLLLLPSLVINSNIEFEQFERLSLTAWQKYIYKLVRLGDAALWCSAFCMVSYP